MRLRGAGRALPIFIVAALAVISLSPRAGKAASPLNRPHDPVVIMGQDLPAFNGVSPALIVGFRYDAGWHQIPVQVDERDTRDLGNIYNAGCPGGSAAGQAYTPPCGFTELVYTDPNTFTGPDSNPNFDSNDQLAFMAKDAGGVAPGSLGLPSGVVSGTGVQVTISDALDSSTGYVYLFRSDGSLDPGAGQQYVSYNFGLLSGSYLSTYNTFNGPNPENSNVTTPYYTHHFSDRWISDALTITVGGSTGVDILDRHKNLFLPSVCVRSENTFSDGEGAFVVNKSGPVRAIRSYIGANSGPLTQRDHIFYAQREDITTYLRVHAIPGVMDFFDYSPAASGMTYYNNLNTGGVAVDGNPDSVAAGAITWEMVTGAQGSLAMAGSVATNISGLSYTSYYLDDSTPPDTQCTGDAFAYGASGVWINQAIPCTDPSQSCTSYLQSARTMYYGAPGMTVANAQTLFNDAAAPLTYTVAPYQPSPAVGGITELANVAPPASGSAWPFVAVTAAGVLMLGAVAWYAGRRRGNGL
jgi:hypothetical protein